METVLLLLAGCLGGFLAGLLGVGGGLIYIPILEYLIMPYTCDSDELVKYTLANSLFLVAMSGVSGSIRQYREGNYYFRQVMATAIPGMVSSVGLTELINRGTWYQPDAFRVFFLLFLVLAFLNMINKKKLASLESTQTMPDPMSFAPIGFAAGVLIAFSGLGGGMIMVPLFLIVLKLEMRTAVAISLSCIPFLVLPALVPYFRAPVIAVPHHTGYLVWNWLFPMMAGVLVFAPLGVRTGQKVSDRTIRVIFAILLGIIIVKTTWKLFN